VAPEPTLHVEFSTRRECGCRDAEATLKVLEVHAGDPTVTKLFRRAASREG
jgi:hypothetical protein